MIVCHRPELLRALKLATQIAGNGKTLPIVANVVLRANGLGKLEILATDTRVSLRALVPCTLGAEMAVMIDARKLHELVANASADDISLVVDDRSWAVVKSGRVTFKIAGQPDANFPSIPTPTGASATVETAVLKEMIQRTWFSACDDETRPNLSGIHLVSDGTRTTAESTDAHRVCRISRSMGMPTVDAIVPCIETLRAILGQTPTCQLTWTKEHLFVTQDLTTVAIKLIDLAYPLVSQIYAMPRAIMITLGREALLIAMKRAGVMTTELTAAKLSFSSGMVSLSVINPDRGEVREDLDVVYEGEPIAIGFNPVYVVELLTQMSSDQVILEIATPLEPALFRQMGSDDYAGIVLPMRVT